MRAHVKKNMVKYFELQTLPDVAALSCVWVHSVDPAHRADSGAVLRHIQVVQGLGEPWWLISVEDHDSDSGLVFKGSSPNESRIHHGINNFYGESVRVAGFIIQKLLGEN